MIYNMVLFSYKDRETELRLYPAPRYDDAVRCDDYGVIHDRFFYNGDCMENPFTGEYEMIKDLDEMERREAESIRCSLSRTKSKVMQLCRGENWEWFLTFTFSPEKVDRYNYEDTSSRLTDWLSGQRKKHTGDGLDLKYMVVPEKHKDGAWHFHGIFTGVKPSLFGLKQFPGHDDFRVQSWRSGFSAATRVKDELAVSNYIMKYITKDMVSVTPGKKRYWCSRNLSLPDRYNVHLTAKSGPGLSPRADRKSVV